MSLFGKDREDVFPAGGSEQSPSSWQSPDPPRYDSPDLDASNPEAANLETPYSGEPHDSGEPHHDALNRDASGDDLSEHSSAEYPVSGHDDREHPTEGRESEPEHASSSADAPVVGRVAAERIELPPPELWADSVASVSRHLDHLTALREQLGEAEQQWGTALVELERQRSELTEQQREHRVSLYRVEHVRERLIQRMNRHRRRVCRWGARQAEMENQLREAVRQRDDLEIQLAKTRRQAESQQGQSAESEARALQELEAARQQCGELEQQLDQLRTELEQERGQQSQQADQQATELAEAQAELEHHRQQLELAKEQADQARGEVERIEADSQHARDELVQAQNQLAKVEVERDQASEELEKTRDELEQTRTEFVQRSEQAEETRGEIESVREQAERARHQADDLEKELNEQRQRIESLCSERDDLREQLEQAQTLSSEPSSQVDPEELNLLRREIGLLESRCGSLESENAELVTQMAEQRAEAQSSHVDPVQSVESMTWEQRKAAILAQLHLEEEAANSEYSPDELRSLRDEIEAVDTEVARRDQEITELRDLLENQASTFRQQREDDSVTMGAAGIASLIDADELIAEERTKLKTIRAEWEDKLRRAEVELSLERAKLARERREMEQRESEMQSLQQQLRPGSNSRTEAQTPPKRKWLQQLGLGGDS